MKKILMIILVLMLTTNIVQAENRLTGTIEAEVESLKVNTDTGEYIENVFLKYDAEVYEEEFTQQLIGDFNYHFNQRKLRARLGLAREFSNSVELNQYLLALDWNENLNLKFGNHLEPAISNYILSTRPENNLKGGIIELISPDFTLKPVYLREDEDLENFEEEVEIFGSRLNFGFFDKADGTATLLKTRPKYETTMNSQHNYLLELNSQPVDRLDINLDLGRSAVDNLAYIQEIEGNFFQLGLDYKINPDLDAKLNYKNVNELYYPVRTTDFKKGYAFRENDYNKGYSLQFDYKQIENLNSIFQFEYSDFYRTNSYLQSYLEDRNIASALEDDRIRTYRLGVMTETANLYSSLFYTRETTDNNTPVTIKVDPNNQATENEDLENEYSPGYIDKLINVVHLYTRYNLLREPNYSLNIDGRYVWNREDNKYHNYNKNFGNQFTESTVILGTNGSYQWSPELDFGFNYNIEQKKAEFIVDNKFVADTKGRQHTLNLNSGYKIQENTSLNLSYQYYRYNLVDYTPIAAESLEIDESEVFRYHDEDFSRQEIKINLKYKF